MQTSDLKMIRILDPVHTGLIIPPNKRDIEMVIRNKRKVPLWQGDFFFETIRDLLSSGI